MRKNNDFCLSLPQVKATFDCEIDAHRLVVLGGRAPDPFWLRSAADGRIVWAADHGAEACRIAGLTPDRALGDFDSISKETMEWLKRLGVKTERFPADKDQTDFQLCLRAGEAALVTGCWGGRFDHAFVNVFSALWNGPNLSVRAFADESEILIPIAGKAALDLEFQTLPMALSLLPLSGICRGVDIHGTKWELDGAELSQSCPCAISNIAARSRVSVRVEQGILGVYCFFKETLNNF